MVTLFLSLQSLLLLFFLIICIFQILNNKKEKFGSMKKADPVHNPKHLQR